MFPDPDTERYGNVAVATLGVESLDANNARDFTEWATPLVEPNARVVLDLTRVRFVDSAGCGAILGFYRRLNSSGGALRICSLSRPVRSMVEMVGMHKVFDIAENREEALRAFGYAPTSVPPVPTSESPGRSPLQQLDENVQPTVYHSGAVEPDELPPLPEQGLPQPDLLRVPGEPPTIQWISPGSAGAPNSKSDDLSKSMPPRRVPLPLLVAIMAIGVLAIGLLAFLIGTYIM
jgi:anti-anti-sigma factor